MFEDIIGREEKPKKKKSKRPRKKINLLPKGQTVNHKQVMKRANKIRRDLEKASECGVKTMARR